MKSAGHVVQSFKFGFPVITKGGYTKKSFATKRTNTKPSTVRLFVADDDGKLLHAGFVEGRVTRR